MRSRSFAQMCAAAALACAHAACTHTVLVKEPVPDARVIIDGKDVGAPGPVGTSVEVTRSPFAIPYEVHGADGGVALGDIPRTEPVWWLVALGAGGAVCCAPSLAAGGFLVANPGIFGAPFVFALTGDVGVLTRSCVSPGWLTVPVMGLCGTAGLSPLGLVFFAEESEAEVGLPPPGSATPTTPSPGAAPASTPLAMGF